MTALYARLRFAHAALAALLVLSAHPLAAQTPIEAITTVSQAFAPESYTVGGKTVNHGAPVAEDFILDTFEIGGTTYAFDAEADAVVVRRYDPASGGPTGTPFGEKQTVWYFGTYDGSVADVAASRVYDEAGALGSRVINRGSNNTFDNARGASISSNVERVDFLFATGLSTSSAALAGAGFPVFERSGGNAFGIAAITALDRSGAPDGYGPLVLVTNNNTAVSPAFSPVSFEQEDGETALEPTGQSGAQDVKGVFVSLADLGVAAGQTIYGYSLFGEDTPPSADLVDYASFPKTEDGGADLVGGGQFFVATNIVFAPDCFTVADEGGSEDQLVGIDRATGASSVIGSGTGGQDIEGIAMQPGGMLYAADGDRLGVIDRTTGTFVLVNPGAPTFGSGDGAAGTITFDEVDGLAFDPFTGRLLGVHRRDGSQEDLLLEIDPATGKVVADAFGAGADYVAVGTRSASPRRNDIDDLAVSPLDGRIFGVANGGGADRLVEIDPATGAVTDLGALGVRDMEGLSFDATGTLYGTTGSTGSDRNAFFTIDPATGSASRVAGLSGGTDFEAVACLTDGVNTVSGTTFFDPNANGVYDDGDTAVSGLPVVLWRDVDGSGTADATTDVRLATTTTAADGSYGFTVAAEGAFVVAYSLGQRGSEAMTTVTSYPVLFAGFGNASVSNDFGTTTSTDLALSMTVDEPSPSRGDAVTFTLVLTNEGLVDATGIQVSHPVLARADTVEIVSAVPETGTYSGTLWEVPMLPPGASIKLAVTVRLLVDQVAFTGLAEVAAVDQVDADSTPYNGATAEDDYASATATTGGSSSGGEGGLESNGTMAQTLANVLYGRRVSDAATLERGESLAPPRLAPAGTAQRSTDLQSIFPAEGPAGSIPFEVSPGDLLPVTNARAVLAADYHRAADNRRTAVLFATTTAPGEIYEHTKVVCDRLRGAVLEGIEHVDILGHPFVLAQLRYPNGSVDYAVSFVAYPTGAGYTVDSRFLLTDYAPEGTGEDVVNVQAWSVSRDYTVDLVERVLSGLGGAVVYRNTEANAPTLPSVFVRRAEYANGRLDIELNNGAAAEHVRLVGGTLARVEGGERTGFEERIELAESDGSVVTATFETGPVFDVAFFVEADAAGADLLYLADGAWGWAADPAGATVETFEVRPDTRGTAGAVVRRVERPARLAGTVETWATLFRYLRPGGGPVDLSDYEWVEFTASGQGDVRMLLEKASIRTSDHFSSSFSLTAGQRRIRIPFADLRRTGGSDGFAGEDAVVLSFFVWGNGSTEAPFALDVSDVVFGKGSAGDGLLPAEPSLASAYPNPFAETVTLAFELPEAQQARLTVYDMLGRRVAVLASGEHEAGYHAVRFDGRHLSAGVYVYRLVLPGHVFSQRMTLVR
ncbi:MAG: SdrD B-like domain-containing protein [Bacteroidota bacterium]